MTETTPPRRPPLHCAGCRMPIAKYIRPHDTWFPCTDCDGALCEDCCDTKKAKEKKP